MPDFLLNLSMKQFCLFVLVLFISNLAGCKEKHTRSGTYTYTVPPDLSDGIPVASAQDHQTDTLQLGRLTKLILSDTIPNIHSVLILKDNFSYFPQEYPFSHEKKKITIRHLLTMTSGLKWNEEVSYRDPRNTELRMDISSDPINFVLSRPMVARPGEIWNYNGGNTELVAEIIKIASGRPIDQFAEKELFAPLGITRYEWMPLTKNRPAAASGLRLRSRDLLKIGMLYMNSGLWNGQPVLTPEWVDLSLSSAVKRPSAQEKNAGYGFQFRTGTVPLNEGTVDIQEAVGNGGQRIFICKSLHLLVVITAGNYNNWKIKNDSKALFVNYILPAVMAG